MLQGLAQFCVALLRFLEQPHVLDSDDRLIGKGLEKSDLFLRERPNFLSTNVNNPNRIPSRSIGVASTVRSPVVNPRALGNSAALPRDLHMKGLPIYYRSPNHRTALTGR